MNRSIIYLKKIDYLIGPSLLKIAVAAKRRPVKISREKLPGNSTERILIVRPGGIGDAALLLPSLKILHGIVPHARIDLLCEKRNYGIFKNSRFVSEILDYRKIEHLAYLLRNEYDLVVDTEQSHMLSTVLVSAIRSRCKVGFDTMGRGSVYEVAIRYSHQDYEVESFFRLFKSVIDKWPAHFEWNFPYIYPLPEDKVKIVSLVKGRNNLVCLFPGASIEERQWPSSSWAKVADSLCLQGFQPVLLGARSEQKICERITREAEGDLLNLCGFLSLIETAALLQESRLLISTDSGILHLGVVCNTPTVSLFGPGIAAKWAPKGKKHTVINKGLQCSPCTKFGETPPCPIGARCIKEIKPDEVLKASMTLLNQQCAGKQ